MDLGNPCTETEACTFPNRVCGYPNCAKGAAEYTAMARKRDVEAYLTLGIEPPSAI